MMYKSITIMPWYSFTPVSIATGDPSDPNQYTLIGSIPPSCPSPNSNLCAIQASDNLGLPILTLPLLIEMANALENVTETSNVLLKP
ncbi:hypothetical protein [Sphingobacterium faecium]|uniref:hypothetical protein n=1 Tax=Sphingobacterium faecium TaxID=34087 RepID=UPI003207F83A